MQRQEGVEGVCKVMTLKSKVSGLQPKLNIESVPGCVESLHYYQMHFKQCLRSC